MVNDGVGTSLETAPANPAEGRGERGGGCVAG